MGTVIYLNIGNTNTQVLWEDQLTTVKTNSIVDHSFSQRVFPVLENDSCQFIISSVVPTANLALQEIFSKAQFTFVDWKMMDWIDFSEVDATTIGADRLCNLGALSKLKLPAMVFDFGTAITSEVLSEDLRFLGGNILPGRQLCRLALEHHTAQLPKTPLTTVAPSILGATTVESIQTIDSFTIGGILYLMSRAQDLFNSHLHVYATGGDAPYFVKHIPDLLQTPSDFTLQGLKEIYARSKTVK